MLPILPDARAASRNPVDARAGHGQAGRTRRRDRPDHGAAREPEDYGFMYQRSLLDPDGHLLEFTYMEPEA